MPRISTVHLAPLALSVLLLGGCGSGDQADSSSPPPLAGKPAASAAPKSAIGAQLTEMAIATDSSKAAAGPVTFKVQNGGQTAHEFAVIRTDKPAGDLLSGTSADEAGKVDELDDLEPGGSKNLKLMLKPGHYALICNLPGHYQAGMHADLTVE